MSAIHPAIDSSVAIDGFRLRYCVEGAGPPALVIGSAQYYPRTFSRKLRDDLKLVFIDHRGFGEAIVPYDAAALDMQTMIGDIDAMRRELRLEKLILLGHSGHGYMAIEYAKAYPQHVSHLVLVAMSPDSTYESFAAADRYLEESVDPERKALLRRNMARLDENPGFPEDAFIARMLASGPRIWYDPTYDAAALWEGVHVNPDIVDRIWGQLLPRLDALDKIEALEVPTFLALGRYDYWNPPHLWERVRNRFRSLRIRVFERSGHTPQLEQSEAFDRELLNWLMETR